MKRMYKIIGIDCADCAAKLEAKLAKIEGIDSVTLNFISQKCSIEARDEMSMDRALEFIEKYDSELEIRRC